MGAAKSSGQAVRVGEVFVECAEKAGFPGFGFSGRATTAPCGGENGAGRKERKLQDHRMAGGCILNTTRDSKMEIPVCSGFATE